MKKFKEAVNPDVPDPDMPESEAVEREREE